MILNKKTDKELKILAKSLHCSIYGSQSCYSCSDVLLYDKVCCELENRGYTIDAVSEIRIER